MREGSVLQVEGLFYRMVDLGVANPSDPLRGPPPYPFWPSDISP